MIEKPDLECRYTAGNIGEPGYAGETTIIPGATPSTDQRDYPTKASDENLSAKFKSPQVSQEVPPLEEARRNNK